MALVTENPLKPKETTKYGLKDDIFKSPRFVLTF